MDEKKIKRCAGNIACGILMFIGGFAALGGAIRFIGEAINGIKEITPFSAALLGAGLTVYAMGAALWNLTEITVNGRRILQKLDEIERKLKD